MQAALATLKLSNSAEQSANLPARFSASHGGSLFFMLQQSGGSLTHHAYTSTTLASSSKWLQASLSNWSELFFYKGFNNDLHVNCHAKTTTPRGALLQRFRPNSASLPTKSYRHLLSIGLIWFDLSLSFALQVNLGVEVTAELPNKVILSLRLLITAIRHKQKRQKAGLWRGRDARSCLSNQTPPSPPHLMNYTRGSGLIAAWVSRISPFITLNKQ